MRIRIACTCGARMTASATPAAAMMVLDIWAKEHFGSGHGECSFAQARRAAEKAEKKLLERER